MSELESAPDRGVLPPHDPSALTIIPHGAGFRLFHRGDVEFCESPALLLVAVTRWRRALAEETRWEVSR